MGPRRSIWVEDLGLAGPAAFFNRAARCAAVSCPNGPGERRPIPCGKTAATAIRSTAVKAARE